MPQRYRFHSLQQLHCPWRLPFQERLSPTLFNMKVTPGGVCIPWRLYVFLFMGRRDRPIHQPHCKRPVTLETPQTPQFLPSFQLPELLLFWQIQEFFSLAVTSWASVSSSSSPSDRRSEICCCSSGLMLFSARMSVRRAVG